MFMFPIDRRGFACAIILLGASFFCGHSLIAAVMTQGYSVIVARPLVSTSTTILFSMKLAQTLAPSSTLRFTFDPAYTVPLSVTPGDGSLTIDGTPRTLGANAGAGVYGYALNGGQIVLNTATDETILNGSTLQLLVGAESGFVTPNATGTALFTTDFYGPTSTLLGSMKGRTIIANPLTVTASSSFATNPLVQVVNLLPELRVGATDTNDDVTYYLTARSGGTALFTQPSLLATDETGFSTNTVELTGLSDTSYDIGIKTQQHLTRILRGVPVSSATTTLLNFTDPANGSATGSQVLLAGDIDGTATGPGSLGDDTINSVDLSILLSQLDDEDLTGNGFRSNLNQDPVVNSVDVSIMIKNLDVQGDR